MENWLLVKGEMVNRELVIGEMMFLMKTNQLPITNNQ